MSLSAQNLALDRGGSRVLSGVSCHIEPGQITAIIGPNGAGKSSLLMALAGLLPLAEGTAELDGRALTDLSHKERARALGYFPQSADIAWDVSVEALVALGRMPHGDASSDTGREAIDAAITALDLSKLRRRCASQLSGGERARVLLARVLAGGPRFILADEPLAAFDLAHQLALLAHFKASAEKGAGVVMVVHDLAAAMNHADRVLVLSSGKLAADGPPQAALTADLIKQVWQVSADWIGDAGAQGLIAKP